MNFTETTDIIFEFVPLGVSSIESTCSIQNYLDQIDAQPQSKLQVASDSTEFNQKVKICHIPPGNPANRRTLIVSKHSLWAHVKNGSLIGSCHNYSESFLDNLAEDLLNMDPVGGATDPLDSFLDDGIEGDEQAAYDPICDESTGLVSDN